MQNTCPRCAAEAAHGFSQHQTELLSRKEAAVYLGVSEHTLAIWKVTGRYRLPVVKIGRLAKYRLSDLNAFIQSRVLGSGTTA